MTARSSQVRSTERRQGVSMAEVVMDDMAIGNPVSPTAQRWRFWASFPGIHIAQFPFQVIGNCGVISLMQCSNRHEISVFAAANSVSDKDWKSGSYPQLGPPGFWRELHPQLSVGGVHNMTVSWHWRPASISSAAG